MKARRIEPVEVTKAIEAVARMAWMLVHDTDTDWRNQRSTEWLLDAGKYYTFARAILSDERIRVVADDQKMDGNWTFDGFERVYRVKGE